MISKLLLLWVLLLPSIVFAQTWQAESADTQIAVLELFTAEGCGLCPAADRFVDALPEHGFGDDKVITLSFHIDYLNDRKAWVDKFASPVFSDRQRQLARLNLYKSVYTPEFVLSGEVIHNWRKYVKEVITAVNNFKPEADIALNVTQQNDKFNLSSSIAVRGDENRKFSKLYFAVVENNLISKVSGGDNAGATFNHQSVVREWLGPISLEATGKTDYQTQVDISDNWNLANVSIIALVQNLDDGFVLQGLKLPLVKE